MLGNLWEYRHFILASIRGELRGRFARSKLGAFWFILHPLAQALIFSVVLSKVMHARMPDMPNPAAYPIYLLSGMAAWGLFGEILTRSMSVFIEQASTLKKISFPRLCLPLIVLGGSMINHWLLLISISVIFVFFGHFPGWSWFALIPGMMLISAMAFGLGVFLGILNVFSRDVAQIMAVVMQLWFWVTPIVYVKDVLPDKVRVLLELNPMTPLVAIYQNAMLLNEPPSILGLAPVALLSLFLLLFSFILFRKAGPELVDAL